MIKHIVAALVLAALVIPTIAEASGKTRTCHTKYDRRHHSSTTICK